MGDEVVLRKNASGPTLQILQEAPNADLNGDGTVSTADYSIFMMHLASQNLHPDFNQDGQESLTI